MMRIWGAALAMVVATGVMAQDITLRPQARPVAENPLAGFRPVARPVSDVGAAVDAPLASQAIDDLTEVPLIAYVSTSSAPEIEVTSALRDQITGPLALIAPGGVDDPSLRPALRPDESAPQPPAEPTALMRPVARTGIRPELAHGVETLALYRAEKNLFAFSPNAIANSLRPQVRPAAFVQRAEAERAAIRRGQVCGDPAIQGEAIGNVPGPGRCGVENAVRVRSIAGVTLTSRAVMNCQTATALKRWIVNGARPAVADTGGGIASLRVIGTYSCRNRNAASTGRLSEHAFGNAIDIAGIGLQNGREVSVLRGWNTSGDGARLRQMWRAACGPFGTVLGPNANRYHRDHFHFDTAGYRSGSYCR